MIVRVLDFETTGLPPDASVCEAAYVDLVGDPLVIGQRSWGWFVKPTTEMSLEAQATHHITDKELENAISWDESQRNLLDDTAIYAAHAADFEKAFFNPDGSRWIDTYKVALRLWPDAPRHTNQVLRYFLALDLDERAMPPHRALPDAWVTAHILLEQLKLASIDDMLGWSDEPPYLTKLTFGKHFGKKYSDVPSGYLKWIVSQTGMDAGVIAAAKRELGA